jgi:hypothetical protein
MMDSIMTVAAPEELFALWLQALQTHDEEDFFYG